MLPDDSLTTLDRRRPLIEDNFWWKTTFDGRQPLMEDNLLWKTTIDGGRPLMEDDLWWKTTLEGVLQGSRYIARLWVCSSPPPAIAHCLIPPCGHFFILASKDSQFFGKHKSQIVLYKKKLITTLIKRERTSNFEIRLWGKSLSVTFWVGEGFHFKAWV